MGVLTHTALHDNAGYGSTDAGLSEQSPQDLHVAAGSLKAEGEMVWTDNFGGGV